MILRTQVDGETLEVRLDENSDLLDQLEDEIERRIIEEIDNN